MLIIGGLSTFAEYRIYQNFSPSKGERNLILRFTIALDLYLLIGSFVTDLDQDQR